MLANTVISQILISGTVVDSLHQPVNNVTVTYGNTNSAVILGFVQTDRNGHFELRPDKGPDSLVLKLSHVGFDGQTFRIANIARTYAFTLLPKPLTLQEVVVKNPPVYKINDTINYNVNAFTSKEDRVIGDVIKKLPGVQVENGKIMYQGKPIQEYLINGLNLLDGQYALANNNLPADAVLKVQVIENHQPIRLLDSLVFSDRASLNLQLKKFTATGSGKIAGGFQPGLWDVSLVPMVFNRDFQMLSSFQSNNTGNDLIAELFQPPSVSSNLFTNQQDMSFRQLDFLAVQSVTTPPFTKRRWLDNNSNLFNSNVIGRSAGGLEVKGNVSYFNDHTLQKGRTLTTDFIPGQNVIVSELSDNGYNTNDFRAGLTLTKNKSNIFFKDNIKVGGQWKIDNGSIIRNDTNNIYQRHTLDSKNLSNEFSAITFWGKQLFQFRSQLNYFENPQQLTVVPGQFDSLFNSGSKYDKVGQTIFYKHFDWDNSISVIKGIGRISIVPRVGFQYGSQRMSSWIETMTGSAKNRLGGDFENNFTFRTTKAYLEINSQYRSKRLRVELNLPEAIMGFDIESHVSKQNSSLTRNAFEPRIFLNYVLSPFWETSLASKYNRQFGEITQLYDGYVLTAYDNLKRFNATIPESQVWENYFSLNYRNALKALFGNIIVLDKQQTNNFLFQNMVDNKGLSTINMLDQKNTSNTLSLNGDIGKYLGFIKTTLKAKAGLALSRSTQIINDELSPIRQIEEDLGFNMNNTWLGFLNLTYDGSIRFLQGRSSGKDMEDITLQVHSLRMGIFPFKSQELAVNIDYYINNAASARDQVFVDLQYRLSIPRTKFNIELSCNNLLNKNMFTNSYNSAYSSIQTSFELRPRQFLLGTWFKF